MTFYKISETKRIFKFDNGIYFETPPNSIYFSFDEIPIIIKQLKKVIK